MNFPERPAQTRREHALPACKRQEKIVKELASFCFAAQGTGVRDQTTAVHLKVDYYEV